MQETLDWLGETSCQEQAAMESDALIEGVAYSCSFLKHQHRWRPFTVQDLLLLDMSAEDNPQASPIRSAVPMRGPLVTG